MSEQQEQNRQHEILNTIESQIERVKQDLFEANASCGKKIEALQNFMKIDEGNIALVKTSFEQTRAELIKKNDQEGLTALQLTEPEVFKNLLGNNGTGFEVKHPEGNGIDAVNKNKVSKIS